MGHSCIAQFAKMKLQLCFFFKTLFLVEMNNTVRQKYITTEANIKFIPHRAATAH